MKIGGVVDNKEGSRSLTAEFRSNGKFGRVLADGI